MTASHEANGVRPSAVVVDFPAHHVIRPQPGHRGDQVVLIHQGQSDTWESIEAFRLDLLRDNREEVDRHIELRVQRRLDKAVADAVHAERLRLLADHRLRLERQLVACLRLAVAGAIFAFVVGLFL